jgi:hypothetical protein
MNPLSGRRPFNSIKVLGQPVPAETPHGLVLDEIGGRFAPAFCPETPRVEMAGFAGSPAD